MGTKGRGRPKTLGLEEAKPIKFERIYDNHDGTKQIWRYDLSKNPFGPISVETTGKRVDNELK